MAASHLSGLHRQRPFGLWIRTRRAEDGEAYREKCHEAPRNKRKRADARQEKGPIENRAERRQLRHRLLERGDAFERLTEAADLLQLRTESGDGRKPDVERGHAIERRLQRRHPVEAWAH